LQNGIISLLNWKSAKSMQVFSIIFHKEQGQEKPDADKNTERSSGQEDTGG
jgi:hypothetical protein